MSSDLTHLRFRILDAKSSVTAVWHDAAADAFQKRQLRPVLAALDDHLRAESALISAIEEAEYAVKS